MAGSVNRVTLIGRLGKDPEIRTTNTGTKVASLSLATSESWKDRASGEKRERTEWHRIVIFNEGLVEVAEKFLKKGSLIDVLGSLQTRKWTDRAGVERYTTEIVLQKYKGEITMLDSRPDNGDIAGGGAGVGEGPGGQHAPDMDDEIPFLDHRPLDLSRKSRFRKA